jgi:subtilisin family serine protease
MNVDVLPGVNLCNNTNDTQILTGNFNGFSNVAGVAAIIRSYYPKLTASQVKHILMDSGVAITENVVVAGNQRQPFFTTLSKSGKIVNAYNALLMADKMSRK